MYQDRWQMTGADMIVAVPWIVFGIALLGLCVSPLLSRRLSRRPFRHLSQRPFRRRSDRDRGKAWNARERC